MLSRYVGIGDVNEVYTRLKQVPADYVNRLKPFFPDLNTEEYLELFNTYIELIDAFITAQMEGNIDELNQITKSLYQNADEH